jgi:hypothetical protein
MRIDQLAIPGRRSDPEKVGYQEDWCPRDVLNIAGVAITLYFPGYILILIWIFDA